jgi:transcription factor TFIIIB component B''
MVDLQKLKMSDLTRDLHIGKKFSRHDELRDRERQARIKAKLEKDGIEVDKDGDGDGDDASTSGQVKPASGTPAASSPAASRPAAGAAAAGPQFRIVDGQIVLDQSSLVMDRHARAVATQQDMETIEENDFTRLITSSSFMNNSKLRGPNIWSAEETELFYHALRTFGTDFEMISKMFPGKQRRHIKLKFNREERHSPALIDAALIGEKTSKMDIDEYKAYTGSEFESVESIEAEQRKIQEGFEAEQKRLADEQAEIMRKKREELFADDDNTNDQGRRKKGSKKKGKDPLQYGIEVEA